MEYYENELYPTWAAKVLYGLEALRNITTGMVAAAILCLEFGNTACIVGGIAAGPLIAYLEYKNSQKRKLMRTKSHEAKL